MRRARVLWIVAIGLLAAGCEPGPMDRLDAEAERLLKTERETSLGRDPNHEADAAPNRPAAGKPSAHVYQTVPPTRNPPPGDLPAQPAAATQPATEPAMIDDDQPPVSMDLEQTLSYAIAHSPEYRSHKEELFLSALSLLIERHLWGPRLFDTLTTQFTGTPEAGDHDQALQVINTLSLTQRLPYGGSVSAGALVSFVQSLRQGSGADEGLSTPAQGQSAQLFLTATLPLLRGAGMSAREDLIQAERDLVYASRTFERYRRQFLVSVSTQYYELLRAAAEIDSRRRQVENFEWLNRRTEALANAGRIALFEVQRAEQQVLFARNNLLNSQELYGARLDALKLTIGMATTRKLVIEPSEVVISTPEVKAAQSVEAALKYRLDLQNIADQADDAKRKAEVARNNLLPDLNLNSDVRINTDPNTLHAGADFELGASSYTAGVTFGAPLDRKIEQLQYRQSLVTLERARRSLTLQRDQVALEVRQSIRQIEQARFTLDLQNRNIEVARKRLRGVLLRLAQLGPRDFIEGQGDLLDASLRRDAALRDLRVSILNYLFNTGQLRVTPEGHWRAPGKLVTTTLPAQSPTPQEILTSEDPPAAGR